MADTKASEAARELLRARWGSRVAVKAAAVVVERASELPDEQIAELAQAAADEADRRALNEPVAS